MPRSQLRLSDNRVGGDVLSLAYGSAAFSDRNVGVNKTVNVSDITVGGADAGNYTFNTTATTTANITGQSLVIDGGWTSISPPPFE